MAPVGAGAGGNDAGTVTSRTNSSRIIDLLRDYGAILGMLGALLVFGLLKPAVLTPANLASVVDQSSSLVILSVGLAIVMMMRGVDLSVAQVSDAAGLLAAMFLVQGQPLLARLPCSPRVRGDGRGRQRAADVLPGCTSDHRDARDDVPGPELRAGAVPGSRGADPVHPAARTQRCLLLPRSGVNRAGIDIDRHRRHRRGRRLCPHQRHRAWPVHQCGRRQCPRCLPRRRQPPARLRRWLRNQRPVRGHLRHGADLAGRLGRARARSNPICWMPS